MKLAILGSSPIALETALRFHLHGASLTWFNFTEVDYEAHFQNVLPASAYTSSEGLGLLERFEKKYTPQAPFNFEHWHEHYAGPLLSYLREEQKVRPLEVISVSKRYLSPAETLAPKTRFLDLFRVIFQVDPQEFIAEQEATNPETFERMSNELVASLQTKIEMYEDFDLVLDLRKAVDPRSLSVTGRALGEFRVSKDKLKYGFEALSMSKEINQDAGDVRELALVGSGDLAAEILSSLFEWLKDLRTRLFVISEEPWPFQKYLEKAEPKSKQALNDLFQYMENEFEKEINDFHLKLREWQELDDFVQAKKPKPVEPIPRLVFFSGHNATAVDQMIDRQRLFLTLEKPDFRDGERHPENNPLDLKTIGVDRIFVANELHKLKIETHLAPQEIGFFSVNPTLPNEAEAWPKDLEKLKGIEHEIFKLFSPAHTPELQ